MFKKIITACLALTLLAGMASAPAGARALEPYVYDGFKLRQGSAEWQVVIYVAKRGTREGLLCGGTVIGTHWILTAAHCFRDAGGAPISTASLAISRGATTLSGDMRTVRIGEVIEHESYRFDVWDNDIALVRTDTAITVGPITLAGGAPPPGAPLRVAGWGQTELAPMSFDLLAAKIPTIANDICGQVPAYKDRLTERLMCAGRPGADACRYDSGGPLYTELAGGGGLQYGIVVAGEGCGKVPGVYARVASYRPWIEQVLARSGATLGPAAPAVASACRVGGDPTIC